MATIEIKGYSITPYHVRDSFSRRALQYKNGIISALSQIGLTENDIEVEVEPNAMKKAPAGASWFIEGRHLHFSYSQMPKHAENLYIVLKVIEAEVTSLLEGKRTLEEFCNDFMEDMDVSKQRLEARRTLGVSDDCMDLEEINKKYKQLAKDAHPDREGGSTEQFKKINTAHKILKRELH